MHVITNRPPARTNSANKAKESGHFIRVPENENGTVKTNCAKKIFRTNYSLTVQSLCLNYHNSLWSSKSKAASKSVYYRRSNCSSRGISLVCCYHKVSVQLYSKMESCLWGISCQHQIRNYRSALLARVSEVDVKDFWISDDWFNGMILCIINNIPWCAFAGDTRIHWKLFLT